MCQKRIGEIAKISARDCAKKELAAGREGRCRSGDPGVARELCRRPSSSATMNNWLATLNRIGVGE
jgi:hypothetical protein